MRRHRTSDLSAEIGQLLIVGFEAAEISAALASLLTRIQPAGVILFARNIESIEQTWHLLKACRDCVRPALFTCVDLEGGSVDRFRKVIGPAPSAAAAFAGGDRRLFFRHGKLIGQSCRAFGFNMDFAPVVDLALPASRTVMASRAVSPDPKEVTVFAREFLGGLAAAREIGGGKHFPGLGEANLDTHHELPRVNKSWRKMWNEDLYPYRALRRQLPFVLVGHASYSALPRHDVPASLSERWIMEILRRKIGYRGLVISDDLEMGGVLQAAPIEDAALGHIAAGGDLCLICRRQDYIESAYERLLREAERDPAFGRRALESAARVRAFKKNSAAMKMRFSPPAANASARLARALWNFSEELHLATIKRQAEA